MVSILARGIIVVGVGVLGSMALGGNSSAVACGNGIEYEIERGVMHVARAEAWLNQGNERAAIQSALNAFKKPKRMNPARGGLVARAMRVFAVAQVRHGGALDVPGFDNDSEPGKLETLQWAVQTLTTLHLRSPKDAAIETELGEAYAVIPAFHDEGLRVLQRLAEADRLTSARGYAALARLLRNEAVDQATFLRAPLRALNEARAQRAEKKCAQMSRGAGYCQAQMPAI